MRPVDSAYNGVFLLLGDSDRVEPFSIPEWVQTIAGIRHASSLEDSQTGGADLFDILFEEGCACFYDSRLIAAAEKFRMVTASQHQPTAKRVLARLGVARANSFLRRYPVATSSIARAAEDARAMGDPLLIQLTHLFELMNASDWGRPVASDALREPTAPTDNASLHALLDVYRLYTLSRALLRGGAREEAVEIMAAVCAKTNFSTISAIPRGMSLRWHGILHTYKGNAVIARTLLENSINIFRAVGYEYGEVQAALSLARVHAPLDRTRTRNYLTRANQILEHTDRPGSESSQGRQMLGERAQINSRLADVEFAQGRFPEALRLYRLDLVETRDVAPADAEHRTPRSIAYIRRNIGRTLAALLQWDAAVEHLVQSVELFESVNDTMNVVFSQALLCEAYVETGRMEDGERLIESMRRVLENKRGRQKEMAIVNLLSASLLWRGQNDSDRAQGKLQEAKDVFRDQDPGYYDVRALMLEAEILASGEDEFTAVQRLREAKRKAVDLELEDLKVRIDGMLERFDKGFNLEAADEFVGKKNLTILFADIRGFTDACQRIDTMMMAAFIKEFADVVSRQVSLGEGRPTRFLGDCVMALFGTRKRQADELLAVRAAGQIWDRFITLRKEWGQRSPDLEKIGLGFGVATGDVMVGRFGSGDLSEYSAIGAAVNLAARLQGAADDGEILMCADTARSVFSFYPNLASEVRSLNLKGIGQTVPTMKVDAAEVFTSVGRIRSDRPTIPPPGARV